MTPVGERSLGSAFGSGVEVGRLLILERRGLMGSFFLNEIFDLLGDISQFVDSGFDEPFFHAASLSL